MSVLEIAGACYLFTSLPFFLGILDTFPSFLEIEGHMPEFWPRDILVRILQGTEPSRYIHIHIIYYEELTHKTWRLVSPRPVVRAGRLETCWYRWSPRAICWRIFSCLGMLVLFCSFIPAAGWMRPIHILEDHLRFSNFIDLNIISPQTPSKLTYRINNQMGCLAEMMCAPYRVSLCTSHTQSCMLSFFASWQVEVRSSRGWGSH